MGGDETLFLAAIDNVLERGQCRAQDLLDRYHSVWDESVEPVFTEMAY